MPEDEKLRRLQEIVALQRKHSAMRTQEFVGQTLSVLVEKNSKKSTDDYAGRISQNLTVVFPKEDYKVGDFVNVQITDCTSGTLIGTAVSLASI